jgi:hypothetical protein
VTFFPGGNLTEGLTVFAPKGGNLMQRVGIGVCHRRLAAPDAASSIDTLYICACSVEVASLVWKDQLSAGRFDTTSPGEGAPSLCRSPGEGDDCRQDSIGVYTQSKKVCLPCVRVIR